MKKKIILFYIMWIVIYPFLITFYLVKHLFSGKIRYFTGFVKASLVKQSVIDKIKSSQL